MKRNLDWLGVALGLISLHYGMGFLLGTGEATYISAKSGALYGLSAATGMLGLIFVTRLYWLEKKPIWILLGKKYGRNVEHIVSLLSWIWMIGIVASQVLGGAFVLSTLGLPPLIGIWGLAVVVNIMALLNINKLSKVFLCTLFISTVAMVFIVLRSFGIEEYWKAVDNFAPFSAGSFSNVFGVAVTTILITILGMDFHQFVVQGRSVGKSVKGEIAAFIALSLLVFLPVTIVYSGRDLIGNELQDAKQALPLILMAEGNRISDSAGSVLVLGLAFAAMGSGTAVARIVNKTLKDFTFLDVRYRGTLFSAVCGILIVGILAVFGRSIISLIVSFYAIYVAGVLVPFLAYVIEEKGFAIFKKEQIYYSLVGGGSVASLIVITKYFFLPTLETSTEFLAVTIGTIGSLIGFVLPVLRRKNILKRKLVR
ncbi:MAG: hypothetical protein HYU80_03830 [Candidatus Blackburnbacteria bacterium]|nr:hypothetical protein [Candidatus Blackburnbacteria bacterium]